MTIIVFLVDTSASMQQRAFVSGRSTLLDVAKGAVEFFVKMRQKSPESRGDRYMLLTFEEFPKNIKAGWKENLQTFINELKNLEASGMTTMGTALKQVFDILNTNRMQSGIDMYGQGRYPFYLEPAVIIVISDGGKLTSQGAVMSDLSLSPSSVPGGELAREPFRWDQRLYALILRMSGTPPMMHETGHVANDHNPVDAMCEVTGGRSYAVTSQRILHQCIDSLVQKLQSGVVIHFEKIGPDPAPVKDGDITPEDEGLPLSRADTIPLDELRDPEDVLNAKGLSFNRDVNGAAGSNPSRPHTPNPILAPSNTAWHNCRRLIFVPRSAQKGFAVGFWPLPEAFWPDVNAPSLPQRSAHPNVKFTCTDYEPMIIENLPFDKYELEPSPLTQYLLARKQPKVCWQVYIPGSGKSLLPTDPTSPIHPFGYLKASTNLMTVNLFVLPYNYPTLLPLLDDLFKIHRLKPTSEWRNNFIAYTRSMPAYYAGPLRRALTRMGAGNLANSLIPETMDNCLSYSVLNYLKRLKNQAKNDYEKILNSTPVTKPRSGPEGIKVLPRSPFKKELLTNSLVKEKFTLLRDQLTDYPGFQLAIRDNSLKFDRYRNPFDIPRSSLLDQVIRMRANFLQPSISNTKLIDDDSKHSLPIGQMGNYQDYLKKMPVPLREIESTPVRQHMFGNPFKINKNMIMDEVVLDEVNFTGSGFASTGQPNRGLKRLPEPMSNPMNLKRSKKGPLPRDFVYRPTPPGTPSYAYTSPCPSPLQVMDGNDCDHVLQFETQLQHPPPIIEEPSTVVEPVCVQMVNGNSHNEKGDFSSSSSSDEEDTEKPLLLDLKEESFDGCSHETESPENGSGGPDREPKLDSFFQVSIQDVCSPPPQPIQVEPTTDCFQDPIVQEEPTDLTITVNGKLSSPPESPMLSPVLKTPPPISEIILSKEELRRVSVLNLNMRQMIYKEVKRPGKNHDRLFEMLRDLHGPPCVRHNYIQDVIREARRFKRNSLVCRIEEEIETLVEPCDSSKTQVT